MFTIGDLALAKFINYPLWPVRILGRNSTRNGLSYLVFCYGTHDKQTVSEDCLVSYAENINEAKRSKTKRVGQAFTEVATFPNIYKEFARTGTSENSSSSSISGLFQQLAATQEEVTITKTKLVADIEKRVAEKIAQNIGTGSSGAVQINTQIITAEIYDAIVLDFNPRFERIENLLKGLKSQIEALENRIFTMENKLDDFEQEAMQDCLIFSGIRQTPGSDLDMTVLNLVKSTMGVSTITREHFVSIQRFRLNSTEDSRNLARRNPDPVAPVLVKLVSKELAYKVFKTKSKLAGSGIYVSEFLTKRRKAILNSARDKFGVKNVWTDKGRIFAKLSSQSAPRRLYSLADTY